VPRRGEDGYEVALLDWLSCAAAGTAEPAARAARAVGDGLVERVAAAVRRGTRSTTTTPTCRAWRT
jgi:hypothetical protein